jgi:hypothetical protein
VERWGQTFGTGDLSWIIGRPAARVTQQVAIKASKKTVGSLPMIVAMLVRKVFRGRLSVCPLSAHMKTVSRL